MRIKPIIPNQVNPKKRSKSLLRFASLLFDKAWVDQYSIPLLISITALGVFFIVATSIYAPSKLPFDNSDGDWAIATNLVNGRGYVSCIESYFPFCSPTNQVTAMREPMGVLVMAATMLISPSQVSGLIVLGLFYLGTLGMIYAVLKINDRRLALLGAFLWVISVPVIQELNDDTGDLACAFFFSVGLFFFQKGRREHAAQYWILSGIFLGLASLSRSVLLGVAIGLGIGLLVEGLKRISQSWRAKLGPALILISSFSLIIAPWIIRNDIVFGTPVIGSTLTGYNLFRMNFIIANDHFVPHYVGPEEADSALMNLVKHSDLSGRENEAQMQAFYMNTGFEIVHQHLVRYLYLSLYRFLPLWFNIGVEEAYGGGFHWKNYVALFQQIVLLLGVLLGIRWNLKDKWPFLVSLVLGCAAYMALAAQLRYLVDIMPAIIILAVLSLPILHP